jgi:hypothetical protein
MKIIIKNGDNFAFTILLVGIVLLFLLSAVVTPKKIHTFETQGWLDSQPTQYQVGFD